jgi:hypothetical protein
LAGEADEAAAAAISRITDSLRAEGFGLLRATTGRDGAAQIREYRAIGCLLLDWELGPAGARGKEASALIREVRRRNADLPIFLLADRTIAGHLPLEVSREIQEYVWLFEDTPAFIAGRVSFAVRRYQRGLLPPFFAALADFSGEHEYSWHTPGHAGGTAFLKTAVGRVFHDFFGEQVFRSDLSVSVGELGSLMDHSGPGRRRRGQRRADLRRGHDLFRPERDLDREPDRRPLLHRAEAIPRLVAEHPERYAGLSLRDLCDQMHSELRAHQVARLLDEAFGTLPVPVMPPSSAYQLVVRDQVEWVTVDDMGERVAAVMVVPYPPGIPLLMPGEQAGGHDGPVLRYLRALQDFDRKFPGFSHDIHGVEAQADGTYRIMCVKRHTVGKRGGRSHA